MFLTISNSDGDVSCRITDEFPDLEGACVRGSELLRSKPDSNYWGYPPEHCPENTVVVLKVEDV